MSIYKKGINDIKMAREIEYSMTNNCGIYMNQTVIGENTTPYHGLFIRQGENNKDEIYLSKVIEQVKIDGKVYNINDINTNEEKIGGVEYLEKSSRYPLPSMEYNISDLVKVEKKYVFDTDANILCINYDIENLSKSSCNIKVLPLVTKRGLFTTKRESMLKLNSDTVPNGVKVTLSITQKKFLHIQSLEGKFKSKPYYINGVKYLYKVSKDEEKMYLEDLYVPGFFEVNVKGKAKGRLSLYIACDMVNISDSEVSFDKLCEKQIEKNKMTTMGIDESFYELKSLAMSASELSYIDKENKKFVLLKSLPNVQNNTDYLKQIIRSIEGNYILLGRYKEAYIILNSIKEKLEKNKEEYTKQNYYELLFMFIEALNKYANSEKALRSEKKAIHEYIIKEVNNILDLKGEDKIYGEDYVINIDKKSYLLINVYWYNALRIYVNITDDVISTKIYKMVEDLRDHIINIFFDEENKVLKYEANDEPYANSDMLFAMDLSYPLIYDKMSMMVIDTAFKKLYTPYGIRRFEVHDKRYDGYVYPNLMATFVNGNLRQNGVTRATQKIAYNLVKELLQEINKASIGTVKYKYDEKTKKAYGMPINALTNAELIRLYNMLT